MYGKAKEGSEEVTVLDADLREGVSISTRKVDKMSHPETGSLVQAAVMLF